MSLRLQLIPQTLIIFNNAVVRHMDFTRAVMVRVGLPPRRRAVRGPADVADAHRPRMRGASIERFFKHGELAGALLGKHTAILKNGNARGIISAVLHALEPFHDNGERFFFAEIAYNTAHTRCNSKFKTKNAK